MIDAPDRRRTLQMSLSALPMLLALATTDHAQSETVAQPAAGAPPDFDFLLGPWRVEHRRLKTKFAGANDWETYEGTTLFQSLLGGVVSANDSLIAGPGGPHRSLGLRGYDAKTQTWADWYLDGRDANRIDPPGIGRFSGGIGAFFSDDTYDGKPIKVRGLFSPLTPTTAQWDQAFSADGGRTWETNYVIHHTRT